MSLNGTNMYENKFYVFKNLNCKDYFLKSKNPYKLIKSFLKGETTEEENNRLKDFLDSYQSENFEWKPEFGNQSEIEERVYKNLRNRMDEASNPGVGFFLRHKRVLRYAAVIVLFVSAALVSKVTNYNQLVADSESQIKESWNSNSDNIVLKLADGTTKIIKVNEENTFTNSKGNVVGVQHQDKISYSNSGINEEEKLIYNELYVPYGKKFKVELFDGSMVVLNSGSSLKYPVKFLNGMPREVFLQGEAYFQVSKNKEQSFRVHANSLVTEVYGTEFNISSYDNEDKQEVVLVEGSVGVTNMGTDEKNEVILKPNYKAALVNNEAKIRTKYVEVENYIAWKDNVLLFNNLRFESIIKKLERHYNVSITNTNLELNNNRYTGTFESETVEQVLTYLSKIRPFTFKREGGKITINS